MADELRNRLLAVEVPNGNPVIRAAGGESMIIKKHHGINHGRTNVESFDSLAVGGCEEANLLTCAGCREPLTVGRESQRTNAAIISFDVTLARPISNVPDADL